jgi:hypothetical protein
LFRLSDIFSSMSAWPAHIFVFMAFAELSFAVACCYIVYLINCSAGSVLSASDTSCKVTHDSTVGSLFRHATWFISSCYSWLFPGLMCCSQIIVLIGGCK